MMKFRAVVPQAAVSYLMEGSVEVKEFTECLYKGLRNGWIDGWMDGRTEGWMDGWMNAVIGAWTTG